MAKYMYASEPNYSRRKAFTEAINTYFDFGDKETRMIMTSPLNESDQNKILVSLTAKLYDLIMDKVDDIDYGEIPRTKGDVTRLSNYQNMIECIDLLGDIFGYYKQNTEPVQVIKDALHNVSNRKEAFQKGFIIKAEFPIFVYDTVVLSIVQSLSLMISTCIEFIKDTSDDGIDIILNNMAVSKTSRHLLFTDLRRFNNECKSGDFDKALDFMMNTKNKENLLGGVSAVGGAILGITLVMNIIPIMRELIYFFYHNRVTFSDYLAVQADLLQINAYNVEHNRLGVNAEERKRIAKRQMKIVETLRKVSNAIAVDAATAEKKTTVDIVKDSKTKYKASDVMDSMPDSVNGNNNGSVF